MSRLVARILLCMLMCPLAVVIYCSIILNIDRLNYWNIDYLRRENIAFLASEFGAWGFIAIYWTLLWRKSIRWTNRRQLAAVISALLGLFILVFAAIALQDSGDWQVKIALLDILIPALWLISTIYFWKETPAERSQRIAVSGHNNVACLACGYNLTGLSEARCPECGVKYTLDELLASQTAHPVGEIE